MHYATVPVAITVQHSGQCISAALLACASAPHIILHHASLGAIMKWL